MKKVDRAVSDTLVKGIDTGSKYIRQLLGRKLRLFRTNADLFPIVDAKNKAASVAGMKADEAQGKAAEMKGEAKGKAEEVKGEVKGQVNEKL